MMTLRDLIDQLELVPLTQNIDMNTSFSNAYASDLLSNALAIVDPDTIWITVQVHGNILGVGSIKQCPAIIISEGSIPCQEVIDKANEKDIQLLASQLPTFELSGLLYSLLKEEQCG